MSADEIKAAAERLLWSIDVYDKYEPEPLIRFEDAIVLVARYALAHLAEAAGARAGEQRLREALKEIQAHLKDCVRDHPFAVDHDTLRCKHHARVLWATEDALSSSAGARGETHKKL